METEKKDFINFSLWLMFQLSTDFSFYLLFS